MSAFCKGRSSFRTLCAFVSCLYLAVVIEKALSGHVVGLANLNYVSHNRVLWKIGKELQAKGHKYTQVLPSCAKENYSDVDVKVFNTTITNEIIEEAHITLMKLDDINTISGAFKLYQAMESMNGMIQKFCKDLFDNDHLISEIRETADIILCDTTNFCCPVLAGALNITGLTFRRLDLWGLLVQCITIPPLHTYPWSTCRTPLKHSHS
jgi:hypothetical protein